LRLKHLKGGKIFWAATLILFLASPAFGTLSTGQGMSSDAAPGRYYSAEEMEALREGAETAIENAAAEAAKAEALAAAEREAALARLQRETAAEAEKWKAEYRRARSGKIKTAIITGLVCFAAGAIGGGTAAIILWRR
jgi:hypothetical protein